MMLETLSRRGLLTGLGSLLAAPAIVRAASLMPVRQPRLLLMDNTVMTMIARIDWKADDNLGWRISLFEQQVT